MQKKLFFVSGLFLLLSVIAAMILWIVISTSANMNFGQAVKEYMSWFPSYISNPIKLTFLIILLLLAAIYFFVLAAKKSQSSFFRTICKALVILSGLLAFWNLFSLM